MALDGSSMWQRTLSSRLLHNISKDTGLELQQAVFFLSCVFAFVVVELSKQTQNLGCPIGEREIK